MADRSPTSDSFDDPPSLAAACATLRRPWLVGVDVDGTIAPIVARPEMSRLEPAARDALDDLAHRPGLTLAVVSGRPLADLRGHFEIPDGVLLLGSHGAETGTAADRLTVAEQRLMRDIEERLKRTVAVLPGAWIEYKPLAVALHVRQVAPVAADDALSALESALGERRDVTLHRGHMVMEIAVRETSKVIAFAQLRTRLTPATTFYIGDDASDERVFASLGHSDVSIKVGAGPTAAHHRLAAPTDVVRFLIALRDRISTDVP